MATLPSSIPNLERIDADRYHHPIRFHHPDELEQPTRADGIPPKTCTRCGMIGPHPAPAACIDALRDRIAKLEFKVGRDQSNKAVSTVATNRKGGSWITAASSRFEES